MASAKNPKASHGKPTNGNSLKAGLRGPTLIEDFHLREKITRLLQQQTALAEKLSRQAADLVEVDLEAAERLLRKALAADLFFGPAHNNLGVVFLKQGKRYEAAGEFEWARKLMPGHPDPRVNLAMTLEEAEKNEAALASYSAALEVYSGYLPAVQGMARLTVLSGGHDERLPTWLEQIAEQSEDPAWRDWAMKEMVRSE